MRDKSKMIKRKLASYILRGRVHDNQHFYKRSESALFSTLHPIQKRIYTQMLNFKNEDGCIVQYFKERT